MNRLPTIIAFVFALVVFSCKPKADADQAEASQNDGAKQEEIANKVMKAMKEFTKATSSVSDIESAKLAATKISEIGERFSAMAAELEPLDPPTKEMRESIEKRMAVVEAERQRVMREKYAKTIQSLHPETQRIMNKSFKGLFEIMQQVQPEFDRHFKVGN